MRRMQVRIQSIRWLHDAFVFCTLIGLGTGDGLTTDGRLHPALHLDRGKYRGQTITNEQIALHMR